MLDRNGQNNSDGEFDWKNAILDASIMGGLTFFTALGGLGTTGSVGIREVLAASIAASTQFFLAIAIKRGLRKKESE